MPRSLPLVAVWTSAAGALVAAVLLYATVGELGAKRLPEKPDAAREVATRAAAGGEGVKSTPEKPDPAPGLDDRARAYYFLTLGPGALWGIGVVVMFGVWFGAIAYLAWGLRVGFNPLPDDGDPPTPWDYFTGSAWGVGVACLFLGTFVVDSAFRPVGFESGPTAYSPVFGHSWKVFVMSVVAFLACAAFVVRLWWVDSLAADRLARGGFDRPLRVRLADLEVLTRLLRTCLVGLGLMVSLSAALRHGLNAYHGREVLSLAAVLAYGLYFTFALAVTYVPIHLRVQELARAVAADAHPADDADPLAHFPRREAVLRQFGMTGEWPEAFRSGVLVASPLLTALLAQVFSTK